MVTVSRMRTRLTELLDIEHPIMLAGMGGVSYHAPRRRGQRGRRHRHVRRVHDERRASSPEEIAKVKQLTAKPFGVDLLTAFPGQVEAGIQRRHRRRGAASSSPASACRAR